MGRGEERSEVLSVQLWMYYGQRYHKERDTAVSGVLPPDCLLSDSQKVTQIQALLYLLYLMMLLVNVVEHVYLWINFRLIQIKSSSVGYCKKIQFYEFTF